jgi:uncharacterized membrane protein YsdA (DUF1294 family)
MLQNLAPWLRLVALALAALNVITFLVYGFDKWMAGGRARRVPEAVLWALALVGGSAGALLGMQFFRHKTRKVSFQFVLALILLLQAAAIALAYWVATGRGPAILGL